MGLAGVVRPHTLADWRAARNAVSGPRSAPASRKGIFPSRPLELAPTARSGANTAISAETEALRAPRSDDPAPPRGKGGAEKAGLARPRSCIECGASGPIDEDCLRCGGEGVYAGHVLEADRVTVTRPAGSPLPLTPSLLLANHSPDGFGWGYGGSGPAQLALALLLDCTGDADTALRWSMSFKWATVARWPTGELADGRALDAGPARGHRMDRRQRTGADDLILRSREVRCPRHPNS